MLLQDYNENCYYYAVRKGTKRFLWLGEYSVDEGKSALTGNREMLARKTQEVDIERIVIRPKAQY